MKKLLLQFTIITFLSLSCVSQQTINEIDGFTKTDWKALNENPVKIIGHDWMLVTAGSLNDGFNMMTASWGGLGWLWEKPVAFIFVRPQRYTFEFTEKEDYFTLTFFESDYKKILGHMGSVSGRDFDKINNSGLTAVSTDNNSVAFKEARIVIECKKIFSTVLKEEDFDNRDIMQSMYPRRDFHTMYVGEIVNVWIKQ